MSTSTNQSRQLSRDRILRVALQLIDSDGLAALSIRRVADELGVYPGAITWHIGTKERLLSDISVLLFEDLELADDRAMTWEEWLRDTAAGWRAQLHRHPNLSTIVGNQLNLSLPALPFVERVLRVLMDAGLRGDQLLHAYNTYSGCLVGWVSLELSRPSGSPAESEAAYQSTMSQLDPRLYTALSGNLSVVGNRAFMVRWASGDINPLDTSFEHMLDTVIQGIHRQLETPIAVRGE